MGGNVLCYAELARHLGAKRPFYGLQARGLNPGQSPNTRIEDMAAQYIQELRRAQPEGPYLLGGWSSGGIVAFEMALQLTRDGEDVALLALLDTSAQPPVDVEWDEVAFLLDVLDDLGVPSSEQELRRLEPEERLRRFTELSTASASFPPGWGLAEVRQMLTMYEAHYRAAYDYRPRRLSGRITLLRTQGSAQPPGGEPPGFLDDPVMGWGELSSQPIEIYTVSGDHQSMVKEPHVRALAERLNQCLTAADPSSPR
jgi:thioesterase domain-containing protein